MPTLQEVFAGALAIKESLSQGKELEAWERSFVIQQFAIDAGRAVGFQSNNPNDNKVKEDCRRELEECQRLCQNFQSKSGGQQGQPQAAPSGDRTDISRETQPAEPPKPGEPVHPGSHRISRAAQPENQTQPSEQPAAQPQGGPPQPVGKIGDGKIAKFILELLTIVLPLIK